jgi:hypothetical protein
VADETTEGPAPAGPPPTPELDRQSQAIEDGAHKIAEFLDWLESEGYVIHEDHDRYADPKKLLADFFGIDLNKIETEKLALLDYIREQQR